MNLLIPIILLGLVGMIIQGAFIAVEHKENFVAAVILKGSASLFFVFIGFLAYNNFLKSAGADNTDPKAGLTNTICLMICLGLVFGLLGDVFLGLRFVFEKIGQKIFLVGILLFFIGHILYMVALFPMSDHLIICILIGAVVAATLLLLMYKTMEIKLAFKIFGFFYIGAVVIMTSIAIGNWISNPSLFAAWFAIGAILFTISDVVMIFNTFGKTQKFSLRITNLSLYYIGQLLIAASMLFAKM
ncbi:MAG: lysoplasmalogenase [Lachnospiraceae bacterium]|nr:lysoplasmalogenase [Lachnospiraceae bacterium]